MTKQELRVLYRKKRAQIPIERRLEMEASILEQVLELIQNRTNIGIFLPIKKFNEIDLTPLLKFSHLNWFVPKASFNERSMYFVQISQNSKIEENEFGIPEPISEDKIDPTGLDAIILPMLIADKNGYRVGYGKGFYDAFLPLCKPECLRIGVCFFSEIDRIIDVEEHDEPIHVCVKPKLD